MIRNWLLRRRAAHMPRVSGFRPRLEVLESRTLLSAGDLDPTFGTGGLALTSFNGSYNDEVRALVRQADGKLLVAGVTGLNHSQVGLARYNADGSLDAGFGTGGTARAALNLSLFQSNLTTALLPDGRFIVGGATYAGIPGYDDFLLARFTADGRLDPTFGTGGVVTTDFDQVYNELVAVVVQPNGKLVALGTQAPVGGTTVLYVSRYNPDGSLDSSFGSGGKRTVDARYLSVAGAVATADGHILVAGSVDLATADNPQLHFSNFSLRSLNPDGSVDATFGVQGLAYQLLSPSPADGQPTAVAMQADGRLVVAGWAQRGSATGIDFAVVRFNANGTLDTTFGTGGFVSTPVGTGAARDQASDVAIAVDGRITAVGQTSTTPNPDQLASVRYNANGSLDASFGTGGIVVSALATPVPPRLALPGTQLVVADTARPGATSDFLLTRLNADGSTDPSFGQGGTVTTDFAGPFNTQNVATVRQPDGKLFVVGTFTATDNTQTVVLLRYLADGSPDPSFGTGGQIVTGPDVKQAVGSVVAAAVQADGKIVLFGNEAGGFGGLILARLNADGSLDTSFSGDGLAAFGNPTLITLSALDVAVQQTGHVLVLILSTVAHGKASSVDLYRYNPDGSPDTSFHPGLPQTYLQHVFVQPDDKIVTLGNDIVYDPAFGQRPIFAVHRLNPDGTADATFGGGSGTRIDTGGLAFSFLSDDFAIQADGRLLITGTRSERATGSASLTVIRLLPDGTLDPSFGAGGYVVTRGGPPADVTLIGGTENATAVEPNGVILVAGGSTVVAYLPDGSRDGRFGSGGMVAFGPRGSDARQVIVLPDGKFLIAGSVYRDGGLPLALARYEGDTAALSPGNDDARFLADLYQRVLGRPVDAVGLQSFGSALDAARARALLDAARGLVTSDEARSRLIAGYYTTFLGRGAGPDEVRPWLSLLQHGGTPEQVLAAILASTEYFQRAGGNNTAWFDRLFRDLLGRDRDTTATVQSLLDAVNQGQATREQVAAILLATGEYHIKRVVTPAYRTYLGRDADIGEAGSWLQLLAQPAGAGGLAPSEQFQVGILASVEYFAKSGGTMQLWLDSLYRKLLGRAPELAGFQANLQPIVTAQASVRRDVTAALFASDEYRRHKAADSYTRFLGGQAPTGVVNFLAGLLRGGATQENALTLLLGSADYFRKAGGTNAGWLDSLYRHVLGRARDASSQGFLDALNSRTLTREQVAAAILASPEYRQGTIRAFYAAYLGRPAGDAEVAIWLAVLQQGQRQEQVLAAIAASNEFFQQAGQGR